MLKNYQKFVVQQVLSFLHIHLFVSIQSRLFGTEKEGKALETLNETRKNLSSISEKIDEITKEIGESALAIEEVNKSE